MQQKVSFSWLILEYPTKKKGEVWEGFLHFIEAPKVVVSLGPEIVLKNTEPNQKETTFQFGL